MRKTGVFVCGVFILLLACDRAEQPLLEMKGANYFPLRVGSFFIYDVDSVSILFKVETKYKFQMKHTVSDSFKNAMGGYTYVITRQKRESETKPWRAAPTWQARTTEREGILIEGNVPYVKLVFPISSGVTWNGNSLNSVKGKESCGDQLSFNCDTYETTVLYDGYTLASGISFPKAVKVVEQDSPDLISLHDVRYSIYARDIGLVERQVVYLNYCSQPSCLGKGEINEGVRFHLSLKEYGQF